VTPPDVPLITIPLALSEVAETACEVADNVVLVRASEVVKSTQCPRCQSALVYRHGTISRKFVDLPVRTKRVLIDVDRQRYRCRNCGKGFFSSLEEFDARRSVTIRLKKYVEEQGLRRTFGELAQDVGVDEGTIRNIMEDHITVLRATRHFETPEILGIDEVHTERIFRLVLTNVGENTVFEVLPKRDRQSLDAYLSELPNRNRVRVVTMDMWRPYRDSVRQNLPQATIVIDKFHVVRMASQAMESVRKKIRLELDRSSRVKLKNDRFLLLRRKSNLTPKQVASLNQILLEYPRLASAYRAKEAFFDIYEVATVHSAKQAYGDWLAGLNEEDLANFKPLVTAMSNWNNEIFAYFTHPYTNAYTESVNALIKGINRNGRGYSFEVLRAKLLYSADAQITRSTTIRKTSWPAATGDTSPSGLLGLVITTTRRSGTTTTIHYFGSSIAYLSQALDSESKDHHLWSIRSTEKNSGMAQ
jgi:transposase